MSTHPGLDHFQREGWKGQVDRVERWRHRVLTALEGSTDGLGDHDVVDYLYAFFQSAHHLSDWLEKGGAAPKVEIRKFVRETPVLQLCRAISNGSKHLTLNASHRTAHVRMMQEYVPPSGNHPAGSGRLRLLGFEARTGAVDYAYVDELMADTVAAWRRFCDSLPKEVSRRASITPGEPLPR